MMALELRGYCVSSSIKATIRADILNDPRLQGASPIARDLFFRMILYINLRDLRHFTDQDILTLSCDSELSSEIRELFDCKLWKKVCDGTYRSCIGHRVKRKVMVAEFDVESLASEFPQVDLAKVRREMLAWLAPRHGRITESLTRRWIDNTLNPPWTKHVGSAGGQRGSQFLSASEKTADVSRQLLQEAHDDDVGF